MSLIERKWKLGPDMREGDGQNPRPPFVYEGPRIHPAEVVEVVPASQLAGAVDRLRWIESYFIGAWPDHDDCAVIWKLAKGDPETVAKFAAREALRHAG